MPNLKRYNNNTQQWEVVGGIPIDKDLVNSNIAADAKAVGDKINNIYSNIGDLSNLSTTEKRNIVSALNEIKDLGNEIIAQPEAPDDIDKIWLDIDDDISDDISPIDATLTQEGMAADAKATGDKLKETILYTPQALTEEQMKQAQKNIGSDKSVGTVESKTVHLAKNILTTNATLVEGWTGNNTSGYTHSSGTAPLEFPIATDRGAIYICRLTTSYTAGEFGTIGIGEMYPILCYKGSKNLVIPVKSDGGHLKINPLTDFNGVLSNISLQKIADVGEEIKIDSRSVYSAGHDDCYGFWNILFGNSGINAPGASRNIALGEDTMYDFEGGHRNVAIGPFAMAHTKGGENNVAISPDAMMNFNGENNVAIGVSALGSGSGFGNIAIGRSALNRDSFKKNNVAIGYQAGNGIVGNNNIAVGLNASAGTVNGVGNIAIGPSAQSPNTGNFNINIGPNARSESGASESISIGPNTVTKKSGQVLIGGRNSNEFILGLRYKIIFDPDGTVKWQKVDPTTLEPV